MAGGFGSWTFHWSMISKISGETHLIGAVDDSNDVWLATVERFD